MRNVASLRAPKNGFLAPKIKGISSWPVFKTHEGAVLFHKMMTRRICVVNHDSTIVQFPWCMYKGPAGTKHMKTKMGVDTGDGTLDNIMLPKTEHVSRLCIVYMTGNVLPINANANERIFKMFGSQEYVFHGPVVVCYVSQDGSRLCKDMTNTQDLDAACADVRKAILAGGVVSRAECFRDAAETDAPLEEATVRAEATAPAEATVPAEATALAEAAAPAEPAAKRAHH